MNNFNKNSNHKNSAGGLVQKNSNLDFNLWITFMKYWSLRTTYPSIPNFWFDLIECDDEFRNIFSDLVADELIKIIENGRLTKEIVDLMR